MTVLTTAGVQCEAHLPFAGLHQLLRPVRERTVDLPPVQRSIVVEAPVSHSIYVSQPRAVADLIKQASREALVEGPASAR
jgi:hypothetical protein